MLVQHPTGSHKTEHKLQDLAVSDEPLPRGANPNGAQKVVAIHDHVHGGVGHERHREQGLGSVEPEIGHDGDGGVVVHVEEGEPSKGAT